MTSNGLSAIAKVFAAIGSYQLGSTRISRSKCNDDHNSIVVGLTLWYGVVLDYNDRFCYSERKASNRGRIMKHALTGWKTCNGDLESLLTFLDQIADMLLQHISDPNGFKDHLLLKEVKTCSVSNWLTSLKGCLLVIFCDAMRHTDEDKVQAVAMIRQISCFLKKLDVDRPDLRVGMEEEFLRFEEFLSLDIPARANFIEYQRDVFEMKAILSEHLNEFSLIPFVPGHGPGAVSESSVKCWFDKHTNAKTDARLGYLLDHAGLGRQKDYLPLISEEKSTRTSRYICVPKTWKKLRGISAEPVELQFVQQGLLRAIDRMFRHDKWWAKRINLHSQQRSRDLALLGSINGSLATIDLSNASDSVTLQLVRDLFGNSELGRWLIGTRSLRTQCGDSVIEINKFAPMGSASCFPTECMIFALAAEVAVRRTHIPSCKTRQVCVFGDDIILPSYAAAELLKILNHIGFSVNHEKSFWEGSFREACGVEAWNGVDIAPCRFRNLKSGVSGRWSDHDEISSVVAFANELFVRGLHDTRAYLLTILFHKRISFKKGPCPRVQQTIFTTFTGECQSLMSQTPTNFNLDKKFSRSLQTNVFRRVVWQERPKKRNLDSAMAESYDVCEYTNWLIRHQSGAQNFDLLWSEGWLDSQGVNPWARLPLGTVMVPTIKWVLPTSENFLRM